MEQCESLNEKLFPPSAEGPTNCPFPKKSEEPKLFHCRDKTGLECDAVLHRKDGSYGLIEIKLGGAGTACWWFRSPA